MGFGFVAVGVFAFGLIRGRLTLPDTSLLPMYLIVPLFSEALAVALIYKSYQTIDVGKAQIIRSCFPFIVLVYSFLLYGKVPMEYQLIGGTLIVFGVAVLISARRIKKNIGIHYKFG